jgi:tRNA pseudouridine55 synthase
VVTVHAIDAVSVSWPNVSCGIRCSKGTYIRSIARDLGDRLGCGGYVWSLRRTAIGPFPVTDALTIDDVQALMMTLTP